MARENIKLNLRKPGGRKLGDKIVGFYTKDKKITIHKKDCINTHSLPSNKEIKVSFTKFTFHMALLIHLRAQLD